MMAFASMRSRTAATAVCLLVVAAAVTAGQASANDRKESALRVFAAASLTEAFKDIARQFERAHPGASIQLNLAGSQQLASQLEQGAVADVFASADQRWIDHAREKGLIEGEAAVFARNRLVVIVPRTNPARIARLQDLARRGIKLVIGAEAVPVGRYSREALSNLSRTEGFDPDFARRTLANVVSEEENVRSVAGKVQLGEADAGMVYRSDVTPALQRYIRVFELPQSANVIARYPIAVVAATKQPGLARELVAFIGSEQGQRTLERHGLMRANPAP